MNKVLRDAAYAAQSQRQTLDLYLPDENNHPHPVVIWLHPGGFLAGSKEIMIDLLAPPLTGRGYAVAAVNYRLADEAVFPAQIYDAKAAVRWLRANAVRFNLDPEKIAAWGCSAGALLAVLLGTTSTVSEMEDLSMGNPAESSAVNAVVDWYGPIDFFQMDSQLAELGYPPIHNREEAGLFKLIGGPKTELEGKCRKLNPTGYIKASNPPFYIQHGNKDNVVPVTQSLGLAEALTSVIGNEKVALNIIENADHFSGKHQSQENIIKIIDFLDKYMKPKS